MTDPDRNSTRFIRAGTWSWVLTRRIPTQCGSCRARDGQRRGDSRARRDVDRRGVYLRALVRVREDMVQNGHAPSADVPTRDDLDTAVDALLRHRLRREG